MFRNVVPFTEKLRRMGALREEALKSFVQFIERALSAEFVVDSRTVPGADRGLGDLFAIADQFRVHGIGSGLFEAPMIYPDEPRIKKWYFSESTGSSGGLASESDRVAATAALAEALERHIWHTEIDYLQNPVRGRSADIAGAIPLDSFAGFQSSLHDEWTWVDAYSWSQNRTVRIPAQTVSQTHLKQHRTDEKRIHPGTTTGLATGVTQVDAVLGGILENIERDAYMTMWLNQLSLPRIDHASFTTPTLRSLLARCVTYGIDVHFVRLITDAPTYVIAAVTRDITALPAFAMGMCADANPDRAAEKALLEALRARTNARRHMEEHPEIADKDPQTIVRTERYVYWNTANRAGQLDFMTAGDVQPLTEEAWKNETNESHFERLRAWFKKDSIECASVTLTKSRKNISPWHIEFVVMPQLQPLYLDERSRTVDGARRRAIAELHGYTPLPEPFTAMPHPFV